MKNPVVMALVGEDGNAFSIMGRFKREARNSGWTQEEIKEVLDDAMSGDYNHLLATIMKYVEEPIIDEEEYDDDDGTENDYYNGPKL